VRTLRHANDGLRFLLELAALASLAYWGFETADGVLGWVLGLGAPLLMAVVWGTFMSPKASHRVDDPVRILAEIAIFGAAVAALAVAGQIVLAVVFGVLVAGHLALTFPLDQRRAPAFRPG
jgi:Protein of unknown function (DUF2568)